MQVSNNKLYFRGISIVAALAHVDSEAAKTALLRAIYDCGPEAVLGVQDAEISAHITAATRGALDGRRVIPIAVVLARFPALSSSAAAEALAAHPIVSEALASLQREEAQ